MEKNPFSLRDFLGYVIPGAVALLFIYAFYLYRCDKFCAEYFYRITFKFSDTLILLLSSYVVGHIVAYMSSLTIEKFSIWLYGYPSDYLLRDIEKGNYFNVQSPNCSIKLIWRLMVAFILLPISICTLIISKLFGVKDFYVRKLDQGLINTIMRCSFQLAEYLRYEVEVDKEIDYQRVISHYEYEVQANHVSKFDNYVALYGFHRVLAFIFNCAFMYLGYDIIHMCFVEKSQISNTLFLAFIGIGLLSYLFFMSFMKFYRRYTLENFMCLIVDKSYRRSDEYTYTSHIL